MYAAICSDAAGLMCTIFVSVNASSYLDGLLVACVCTGLQHLASARRIGL